MARLAFGEDSPTTTELGSRVRSERERLGLSQAEAARTLGIARPSYRQIEAHTTLQYGMLLHFVRVLGMDPGRLAPELYPRRSMGRGVVPDPPATP